MNYLNLAHLIKHFADVLGSDYDTVEGYYGEHIEAIEDTPDIEHFAEVLTDELQADYGGDLNERNICDSKTLCNQLLDDTGVALLPGSDFGREAKELSARLAYTAAESAGARCGAFQ